jgi:glycosyltransferase involved in cell wall biosynthesis
MLERDRSARARILWVEACVLTPDQDSGSLRTLRLLKILVGMGCKVTFVADNLQNHQPYVGQLEAEGIEVLRTPFVKSVANYLREFGPDYDVITLCRHYIAIQYVDLVRQHCPQAQVWFDTIDLHYLRLRRQYALDNNPATKSLSELAYREEMEVIKKSDITIVVSDVEVAEIAVEAPSARVEVVSNIHELHDGKTQREGREHIMFVGGFQHPPNVDAVEFFAEQIWPAFRASHPETKALIIGSKMPDSLRAYGERRGLEMVGFVEDLTPYYQNCVMAIAPLRYGAGVKGKVNQALSFGLPVVGTAAAVEGMGLEHGREAMCADTPEDFVSAMTEVMTDTVLWQTLSEQGKASLARAFSTEVAEQALVGMLAGVIQEPAKQE